jgi:hypothetical protein
MCMESKKRRYFVQIKVFCVVWHSGTFEVDTGILIEYAILVDVHKMGNWFGYIGRFQEDNYSDYPSLYMLHMQPNQHFTLHIAAL